MPVASNECSSLGRQSNFNLQVLQVLVCFEVTSQVQQRRELPIYHIPMECGKKAAQRGDKDLR